MTEKCKNLLQKIAYNENQFEKKERLKDSDQTKKQKSLSKLQSSKSFSKNLESQKFLEKLKAKIEKEKNLPLNIESNHSKPKMGKKYAKFHLKSEYLPKEGTFITQASEIFLSSYNGFNTYHNFLRDEVSNNEYYSKITLEGLERMKKAVHKFNGLGLFEKNNEKRDILYNKDIYSARGNNKICRIARTGNEPIIEISVKEKTIFDLNQLEFYYFKIKIENKESPLILTLKNVDKKIKPKTKFFLSTSNTWPNRFNCEDIIDGNFFKYWDSDKNTFFLKEFLYFSIYAAESLQTTFKVKFGFENKGFLKEKNEQSIIKTEKMMEIKYLSQYILNEQIKTIHAKRRRKWKMIGAGNKVAINKNMQFFQPETQEKQRLDKKNRALNLNYRVNSMKSLLEKKNIEHKLYLMEKPAILRQSKEMIRETINEHFKKLFKMKSWIKLIHRVIKKKMHESYLSQIRRKTLSKLVAFTRMIGSSANERVIMDSKFSVGYFLNPKRQKIMRRCKQVVCKSVVLIAKMHELVEKSMTIQRKWKMLQRKKVFFKLLIKDLWKQRFNEFYLELKGIYSKSSEKSNKKKNQSIDNLDTELQAKIMNDFVIDNLKRWRKEMDEYRENMQDIRSDVKKFTQMFVLKHFTVDENAQVATPNDKQNKNIFSFNFENTNNKNKGVVEPPFLYSKPTDYDLKKMIKIYLENKNII